MTKEELKKFIIDNFPIKNGKLTTDPVRWCNRKYSHLIDIINGYGEYDKLSDNIYSIILGKTNRCHTCGKLISLTWKTRDNKYCSRKCMGASTEWKELCKKTVNERYGVDNPFQSEAIKEKIRQTSLERYGTTNPMHNPAVKEKLKKTVNERYGVDNPFQSEAIKEKIRQTSLERYGVPNPAMSEEIIKKIDDAFYSRYGVRRASQVDEFKQKQNNTNIERYGHINPMACLHVREKRDNTMLARYGTTQPLYVDEFKQKRDNTNLERYGNISPLGHPAVKEKKINTMLERYGVVHPMHIPAVKEKLENTNLERYGTTHYAQSDEYKKLVKERRREYVGSLGLEYCDNLLIGPTKYGMVSKECIKAQLDGTVTREMLVSEFSDYHRVMKKLGIEATGNITTPHQILIDWLKEINVEFKINDRRTIKPKELDIFIPTHSLAIEVNGLYWHSTTTTDRQHIDKFNQCRLLGIKLLQFTDRDIIERPELVKGMILSKLGLLPNKLMARKCSIVHVESTDAQKLLDQWHYQGRTTNAARFMGLTHDNRIVAIIGYTIKDKECRIERFACELMTNVVGGYSKLEKFVIKSNSIKTLVTFSLGLISDGSLYSKNGYTTDGYSPKPEWYVTDYKNLYNRQRFMKSKLHKMFGDKFDPNKTERENILMNGFRLYFGAGITKWVKEV